MRDASNPQTSKQEGVAPEKLPFQFQLPLRDGREGFQHAPALGTANPCSNWLFQSVPLVETVDANGGGDGGTKEGAPAAGVTTVDGSMLLDDEVQRQKTEKQREKNRERARRWRARKKAAKLLDRQVEKVHAELPKVPMLNVGVPSMNPTNPSQSPAVLCVAGVPVIDRDGLGVAGPLELERLERVREKNRERARRYRARQKKKKLDTVEREPSPNDVVHKPSREIPTPPDVTEVVETVPKFPASSSVGRQQIPTLAVRDCDEGQLVDERQRKLEDQRAKNRERVRRWRARQKAKRVEASSAGQQQGAVSSTSNHQADQGVFLPLGIGQQHSSYPQTSGLNELANLADMELVRMQQAVVESATGGGQEKPSVTQLDLREAEIRAVVDRCVGNTASHNVGQVSHISQHYGDGNGGGQDGLILANIPSTTPTTMSTESIPFPVPHEVELDRTPVGYVAFNGHIPMRERRRMARDHHLELLERVQQCHCDTLDYAGNKEAASGHNHVDIDRNSNEIVHPALFVPGGGVHLVGAREVDYGVDGGRDGVKRQRVAAKQLLDELVGAVSEGGGKAVEINPSLVCPVPETQLKAGEGPPAVHSVINDRFGNDGSVVGVQVGSLGFEGNSAMNLVGSEIAGNFVDNQSGPQPILMSMSGGQMDLT